VNGPAVHQLLATLSHGDAIGNQALAIQAHLRRAGFTSDIFAETAHPRMASHARPLWEYAQVSSAETVCLFHFAVGSAAGPLIHTTPSRLVLLYHNVTPADYFLGFQNHIVGLCYHGRRGLAAFADRAELALGVSEFNRRELEAAGFRRTGVLPIVPDLEAPARPRSPVVQRLYADGRTNVLFVGRVIPNKKIEDLLRAFAVFQRHIESRSRLLLVGDHAACPKYLKALQDMAAALRLRDVVFTGHVDDAELRTYYGLAHLFLCLSEHEGYCVPLVEAMSFGLPVVAYDAGAVAETLRGAGLLLRDKRPEVVAEAMAAVLGDGDLRRRVLRSEERTLAALRATDFGALLLERLSPVLGRPAA
jgi:glycosyltransferase involved in cell wall biosynthesis